jgi:hypothetical protein
MVLCFARFVDFADIWVVYGRRALGFPNQALPCDAVVVLFSRQEFESHAPLQDGIDSKVDFAHASVAEFAEYRISPEAIAGIHDRTPDDDSVDVEVTDSLDGAFPQSWAPSSAKRGFSADTCFKSLRV